MHTPGDLHQRLAKSCLDLVQITSVSGTEKPIVDYLEHWAKTTGGYSRDAVVRLGNALLVGKPDGKRPTIALVGHVDTVPLSEGNGPAIRSERVYGRGAADMKGALAVMLSLGEMSHQHAWPFSLVLAFYDKEEGPFADNGLQPLLDQSNVLQSADLAIVMEPTNNWIQLGCLGSLQARVVFGGKSAHSARPWQGENALYKTLPLLTWLSRQDVAVVTVDDLPFRTSMSATLINGGRAKNVIPDTCEVNVNWRYSPLLSKEQAEAQILQMLQPVCGAAEVTIVDHAPAARLPGENPVYDHLRTVCQLDVQAKEAWTDVARLAAVGIDAINFGPGDPAEAHQAGESIGIAAMVQCHHALARFLSTPMDGVA